MLFRDLVMVYESRSCGFWIFFCILGWIAWLNDWQEWRDHLGFDVQMENSYFLATRKVQTFWLSVKKTNKQMFNFVRFVIQR